MARHATGAAQRVAVAAEALRDEKFNARRVELAEAALETLGELGFARTSLREIAQNSAFTHGVFHYYFSDKLDLICCCVRHYKAKCVTRYDEVVTTARSRAELTEGFLAKLAATLENEARMHRLWYDLRSQAMFEPAFRKDVAQAPRRRRESGLRSARRSPPPAADDLLKRYESFVARMKRIGMRHRVTNRLCPDDSCANERRAR